MRRHMTGNQPNFPALGELVYFQPCLQMTVVNRVEGPAEAGHQG